MPVPVRRAYRLDGGVGIPGVPGRFRRAGTAVAFVAAFFGRTQAQVLAQQFEQRAVGWHGVAFNRAAPVQKTQGGVWHETVIQKVEQNAVWHDPD